MTVLVVEDDLGPEWTARINTRLLRLLAQLPVTKAAVCIIIGGTGYTF